MKDAHPTIAIVIPAYNEAENLAQCLDSIARQHDMPDQVIVVNNNSSDQTEAIAKSYDFVTLLNEPVQGIAHARNTGFNYVSSDIIGRIDADSKLDPNWVHLLRRYYHVQTHRDHAVSGMGYFYNMAWPKLFGKIQFLMAFQLNRLILGAPIVWGSNMALPHHVWQQIAANTETRNDIHEDIDLAIHLKLQGFKVDFRRSLVVGVKMRRVHTDRAKLWANLLLWPHTFRVHGFKRWPIAFCGSVVLLLAVFPGLLAEKIAILFGKTSGLKRRRNIY